MDENGRIPDDHSLLDLFRTEVEHHTGAISDGLMALRKDATSTDRLDSMVRAAHAIKGGAQILDLEAAITVARAMEASLVAAQKGELAIGGPDTEILLNGVDMLHRIAHSASEPEWIASHEEEIGRLVAAIHELLSPSPSQQDVQPITQTPPPPDNGKRLSPRPEAALSHRSVVVDPTMLDLFRTEVQNQIATLNDGLLNLDKNPNAINAVDPMIRAAHSIKGAARIVGFVVAGRVAQAMEEALTSVRKDGMLLAPDQIRLLLQGVDMLNRIVRSVDANGLESLDWPQSEIDLLVDAIQDIPTTKEGVPTQVRPPDTPAGHGAPRTTDRTGGEGYADNVDPTMLDLFQTEVETHVAVLNDGLLALETNPGATDQLEALMRAAHSIKGGARVLGLDVAVRAAHVMEDCFVAAQKGEVSLGPDQIDILLRIVDILTQLAHSLGAGETDWLARHREEIDRLVGAISTIISGEQAVHVSPVEVVATEPAAPVVKESAGLIPVQSKPPADLPSEAVSDSLPQVRGGEDRDRTVRVTAGKIERLMGQAGEVVVNARWLPAFSDALLELKKDHGDLLAILDGLQEALVQGKSGSEALDLVLEARTKTKDCSRKIGERLNQFDLFNSTSAALSDRLYHEVISVRMRPFSDGVQGFPRLVRDIARELGKKVRLEIKGKSTEVDRDILEKLDAPLNHLLRNAVDHGIEPAEDRLLAGKPEGGVLRLEAAHRSGMLMITLADDGRGIDLDRLRRKIVEKGLAGQDMVEKMSEPELLDFLFLPGFSTAQNVTEISGRGVGLDVVRNMVHDVGGVVRAISRPGEGMTFHMELPLTLSVVRTFLVEIAHEPYAFPLARIERCLEVPRTDISTVEDRQYFRFDDTNIALVDIHNVLELTAAPERQGNLSVVVVSDRLNSYGLSVDRFIGEYDLVVRPLDPRLGKVPDISSVAVMLDGSPVLIFDVEDLVRSIDNLLTGRRLRKLSRETSKDATRQKKRVLVVDDSFTVREMERKLLESKGYHVETAVDGVDGWNAVRAAHYDMVVSDVDMPRMNGIEFIKQIKQHPELKSLPVIIVSYKDKEEDRLLGLEAGANYYLTKSSFEDDSLMRAAADLIGEA